MTARLRSRAVAVVAVGAALAGLAVLGATAATPAGATRLPAEPAAAPARLLVYAQEWSLWPSRPSLRAGRVVVQLWNRGQDAHDLRIRRLRHGVMVGGTQGVVVTQSGRLSQATWRLTPGTYQLYCSMPGHMRRGMRTRIVVR